MNLEYFTDEQIAEHGIGIEDFAPVEFDYVILTLSEFGAQTLEGIANYAGVSVSTTAFILSDLIEANRAYHRFGSDGAPFFGLTARGISELSFVINPKDSDN